MIIDSMSAVAGTGTNKYITQHYQYGACRVQHSTFPKRRSSKTTVEFHHSVAFTLSTGGGGMFVHCCLPVACVAYSVMRDELGLDTIGALTLPSREILHIFAALELQCLYIHTLGR